MKKKFNSCTLLLLTAFSTSIFAQTGPKYDQQLNISGYFGLVHPIATLQGGDVRMNFDDSYSIGFVTGINFQKNPKYGYTLEIVPTIVSTSKASSVKNIVVQPGVYFPFRNGWKFTNRLSFETSGRYGVTPSISKVLIKGSHPLALTIPISLRFGNEQDFSLGSAVLFTVAI